MERTFVGPVDERQVSEILNGNIRTLQEPRPRIVRLYLSSTVGDVDLERERLYRDIFPGLARISFQFGLQFQLVDFQHGLPLEQWREHVSLELVSGEVALCQQLTVGPSMVTLLAQRYGYRPLPRHIPATVYQHIATATDDPNLTSEGRRLVGQWYRLDENAVPPAYRLRPRNERLPNLDSSNEGLVLAAKDAWKQIEAVLTVVIHSATGTVVKDRVPRQALLMSLIEAELTHGVFQCPDDPNKHIIWLKRFLISLKQQMLKEPDVARGYLDTAMVTRAGRLKLDTDIEAQRLLNSLRDDKMVAKYVGLDKMNIHSYELRWISGGINPTQHKLHRDYFAKFTEDARSSLEECLRRNFAAYEEQIGDVLYQEVLQHVHDIKTKCRNVATTGVDKVLAKIEAYLSRESPGQPLVVHGAQGSGKSARVGQAILRLRERYGNSARIVVRSIEATASSRNIRLLLDGLCQQLCRIYDAQEEATFTDNSYRNLLSLFPKLLLLAEPNHPLFIFLDGLEHLLPQYGALNMEWLPWQLPKHVYLVVSTAEEPVCRCFPELQNRIHDNALFVQVPELSAVECRHLTEKVLKQLGRTLTASQWQLFMDAAVLCPTPQFVRLSCEHVLRHWTSDQDPASVDLHVPGTSRDIIFGVFERVERRFGWQLVNHALGYVTAGKHGLSEPELLDMLSCDERIMDELSLKMSLPERRFPFLLWSELRQALGNLLVFTGVDNCCVLRWSSRLVEEAAQDRYLTRAVKRDRHSALADFFLAKWHRVAKPYRCKQRVQDGILATDASEDRRVMAQPLVFNTPTLPSPPPSPSPTTATAKEDEDAGDHSPPTSAEDSDAGEEAKSLAVRYNLRKLNELPFQLVEAGRLEELRQTVLTDYHWLLTKLRASSVASLVADFSPLVPHLPQNREECSVSDELRLLRDTLVLASPSLERSAAHFGAELLARLPPLMSGRCQWPLLKKLLVAAESDNVNASIVPLGCPLKVAGQFAMPALRSHHEAVTCLAMTTVSSSTDRLQCGGKERLVLVSGSQDGTARYWDAFTGDMQQLLEGHQAAITAVAMDAKGELCATCDQSGEIRLWSVMAGVCEAVLTGHTGRVNSLAMLSHSHRTVSVGNDGVMRFWNTDLASSGLGKELFQACGHVAETAVRCVALLDGEERLCSGGDDANVLVWGQLSAELLLKLVFHSQPITTLAAYPGRPHMVASGSADRSVALWNLDQPGKPALVFRGHISPVTGVAIDRHSNTMVTSAQDASVRVWDACNGAKLCTVPLPATSLSPGTGGGAVASQPTAVLQCVEGRFCLCALDNATILPLDLRATPHQAVSRAHRARVTALVTGGDDVVLSGAQDGSVFAWRAGEGGATGSVRCASPVKALCLLPEQGREQDGRHGRLSFLSAHSDGQLHCWGTDTEDDWRCERTYVKHRRAINDVAQHAGRLAVTSSDDGSSLVWEVRSGRVLSRLVGHRAPVIGVTVTTMDDDALVAITASKDGTANLYRLRQLEDAKVVGGSAAGDTHLANVIIADISPFRQLRPQPTGPLASICMDPSGEHVLLASIGQATISLWNIRADSSQQQGLEMQPAPQQQQQQQEQQHQQLPHQQVQPTGRIHLSRALVVTLRPIGGLVAVGNAMRCIQLYDTSAPNAAVASVMSEEGITAVAASTGGGQNIVVWGDGQGRVYRAKIRLRGEPAVTDDLWKPAALPPAAVAPRPASRQRKEKPVQAITPAPVKPLHAKPWKAYGLATQPSSSQSGLPTQPSSSQSGLPTQPSSSQSGLPTQPSSSQSGLPTQPSSSPSPPPSQVAAGAEEDSDGGFGHEVDTYSAQAEGSQVPPLPVSRNSTAAFSSGKTNAQRDAESNLSRAPAPEYGTERVAATGNATASSREAGQADQPEFIVEFLSREQVAQGEEHELDDEGTTDPGSLSQEGIPEKDAPPAAAKAATATGPVVGDGTVVGDGSTAAKGGKGQATSSAACVLL